MLLLVLLLVLQDLLLQCSILMFKEQLFLF
jgi:hypothetical protein